MFRDNLKWGLTPGRSYGVLEQDTNLNEKEIKDFDAHVPSEEVNAFAQRVTSTSDESKAAILQFFLADVRPTKTAEQTMKVALTSQELVELLKMPTVFGKARVVILDNLGNRYRRKFANHWQFVRYAQEHNLDFTKSLRHQEFSLLSHQIARS